MIQAQQAKRNSHAGNIGIIIRCDGVVVRASASQPADLGFNPLVELNQKTSKKGIRSFLAWRSAFRESCGEQAGKFACSVYGQGTSKDVPTFMWKTGGPDM